MKPKILAAILIVFISLGSTSAQAQSYLDLEDQVQEFTLANGITFLVLGRHDVPVFSFNTYLNAGSSDEVTGITGIAHILEHMAFKGTDQIGTENYRKEKAAMAAEDAAFALLRAERAKGALADPAKLDELEQAFEAAKDAAREFVVTGEFDQIVENNGGHGMNASTWVDATNYYYNLPANRLELWAYLEGSRMANPVLREFYTEKDGPVTEERRMRVDNNPWGILIEQFQNLAFSAHPYHHRTIGYMSDIENISRQDCEEFYRKYYVGKNMTVAVVGDVEFAEVKQLAERYFKDVSAAEPPKMTTVEPPQLGEKRMRIFHESQPIYAAGYHIGNINHPDFPVYEVIADILGQGRTSRLYKALVKEQKLAVYVGTMAGFPDNKYPSLIGVMAVPVKDVTALEVEESIFVEIDKLVEEGVTQEELTGVKQRAKANFIRSLRSNQGLASQLGHYQAKTGDWRNMFTQVEKIEAVTADDVQRVAEEIFDAKNRTVVYIETIEEES